MHTGMLHTHTLSVILFLILYVVKSILLFANRKEALESVRKKTRLAEMIISTTFLLTGIYLAATAGEGQLGTWFYIKLALIIGSIVTGVIAFKKQNKPLAAIMLLALLYAYGLSETKSITMKKTDTSSLIKEEVSGSAIYAKLNCAACHGADGNAGMSGAKSLSQSTLSNEEIKAIIRQGKNGMPSHQLQDAQLDSLVAFVVSLRR